MYEVYVTTQFSAAHRLKGHDGQFENLHGHNWTASVTAEAQELNEIGVGIDFIKLKEKVESCLSVLDYKNINEVPPFDKDNPSAENIARWLFKKLSADLNHGGVRIKKVEIYEMPNCGASYYE
ncbi:MAG: 6-carboxytetrahydropterin synthase [Nitrospinae bacterium]|nr:6-carboxytetrahydropterin synthase [Nitrospinota bacterium]